MPSGLILYAVLSGPNVFPMTNSEFLSGIFTTNDFREEDLREILPKFRQVHFAKHDYLLREGRTEQDYWFLESGFARSYATDTAGADITTGFFAPGEIVIDWPSFFLRAPTRESIQALTDCNGWALDYETFQQLFHSIEGFREQGRRRLVNSYFSLKRHSVSMIADAAKDRYRRLLEETPHLVQHVSLKHIATFLGITDTSLSRIRKELSQE